jgi:hypothetical protein
MKNLLAILATSEKKINESEEKIKKVLEATKKRALRIKQGTSVFEMKTSAGKSLSRLLFCCPLCAAVRVSSVIYLTKHYLFYVFI